MLSQSVEAEGAAREEIPDDGGGDDVEEASRPSMEASTGKWDSVEGVCHAPGTKRNASANVLSQKIAAFSQWLSFKLLL